MKAQFNFIKSLNAWLLSGFCFLFKAFVTAVVREGCDPALLQSVSGGLWLFWSCSPGPRPALTCSQWSSVWMGVGGGCNSQCWVCCKGRAGSRGCSEHTAHAMTWMPAATQGPKPLELRLCQCGCKEPGAKHLCGLVFPF